MTCKACPPSCSNGLCNTEDLLKYSNEAKFVHDYLVTVQLTDKTPNLHALQIIHPYTILLILHWSVIFINPI